MSYSTDKIQAKHIFAILLCLSYFIFVCFAIRHYSFDWPHNDDYENIHWYVNYFIDHTWSLSDLIARHNGSHLMGFQVIFTVTIFKIFGISFLNIIYCNIIIISLTALMMLLYSRKFFSSSLSYMLLPLLILIMAFHPVQTNHLTWAFEFGWFCINFFLIANVLIVERLRFVGLPLLLLSLLCASFCSAQSAGLWPVAALHIFLLRDYRFRLPCAALLLGGFIVDVATILIITPHGEGVLDIKSVSDLLTFFLSMFGGMFAVRDIAVLVPLGALIFLGSVGFMGQLLLRKQRSGLDRAIIVLIFAVICYMAILVKGRYQNGLPSILAQFHMGPLLVPLLFALTLKALSLYEQEPPALRTKAAGLGLVLFLLASVGVSVPYALERGRDTLNKEALAMHVMCNPGYSPYIIENANITQGFYAILMDNFPRLSHLCTDREPASVRPLESLPADYVSMSENDPALRAALADLWDVYATHFDLQRAFPPDQAKKMLLDLAVTGAKAGQIYAPEILQQHVETFKRLRND